MKKIILCKFALSLLLLNFLQAKELVSLEWLKTKPKSITKDFYIWRYLQQDISPQEAKEAYLQVKNENARLLKLYAKKANDEIGEIAKCQNTKVTKLLKTNAKCINAGLTVNSAIKLSASQKEKAIKMLKKEYSQKAKTIAILNNKAPFSKLLKAEPAVFFELINKANMGYVQNNLNHKIPKKTLNKFAKHKEFNNTINRITTTWELHKLQRSLLEPFNTDYLNSQSLFFLGLNALKYNENKLAQNYLEKAKDKAIKIKDRDKALFWLYLVSKKTNYLEELSNSFDINFYSIYAKDLQNKNIENIFYDVEILENSKFADFDQSDPFVWIEKINGAKYTFEDKVQMFSNTQAKPHLAYILQRSSENQTHYFLTPFEEHLENYDLKRQALVYALGRQESNFISGSVSTAYALGVMQIMPFLSEDIAEELNEQYSIDEQFNPEVNLRYANHHLNFLEKKLQHPLFIAYAYNGGIGFATKMLKKRKGFFQKNKKYEPFLSMELISNSESREYAKQVLANYYVYSNYLDKKNPLKFSTLLESLSSSYQN